MLNLRLIIGAFSLTVFICSCNNNSSENNVPLFEKFYSDILISNNSEYYGIITPSSCNDCIKKDSAIIGLLSKRQKSVITIVLDDQMAESLKELLKLNYKSKVISNNIFGRYGLTKSYVMFIKVHNNKVIDNILYTGLNSNEILEFVR